MNQRTLTPQLEKMLSAAAERRVAQPAPRTLRARLGGHVSRTLGIGLASLALVGTAMAAAGVWDPGIGSHAAFSPPPSISSSPVPAAVTAEIGALRRAPDAADRGPAVEATLSELGSGTVANIQPDSVRFLEESAPGEATILFSGAGREGGEGDKAGSVCVGGPGNSGEGGARCAGLGEIMAGKAFWPVQESYLRDGNETIGPGQADGIVPDGVASLTVTMSNGVERAVTVHDNYFHFTWGPSEAAPSLDEFEWSAFQVTWHDASGAVVPKGTNNLTDEQARRAK
jgi:hypothetical protein